ncbi:MAG TPA: Gldg family protein [Coleofasciculaceae cyanobacterium]
MKTIKKNAKYLSYLFWFGPALTIMGLSARVVSAQWSPIAVGLLIAGLVIIGLWLVFLGSLTPGFWGRRSTQVGTNALISTLAMLVIVGLINFLAVRYGARVDLTENQLFTLSPMSQQVVKNLQQPVKVWVFNPNPQLSDRELLQNYRRYGSNLQFEFVDPQLQPGLAQKFDLKSLGEVYLEYGQARKLVQTVNDGERLSETKLTNAIEQLTSDRTDTVYFLQGHGERPLEAEEGGFSQAVTALKDKNFTVQPLNLAERSEVPKDASLVVIAGPKRALFEAEVQALRTYLSAGGSLLLMIDPDSNPGLDSLLADWGVKVDNQIVVDASGQGRLVNLGPATPLVTSYGNHPITQDFGNGYSFYPLARPIETKPVQGVTETPLVTTNDQSWGESTPEKQPLQFDPNSDRPGPLTLGVALSRKAQAPLPAPTPTPTPATSPQASPTPSPTGSPTASPSPTPSPTPSPSTQPTAPPSPNAQENATQKRTESRLVVYGNSSFVADGWFEQPGLNSDVFLNSVSWLSNRDDRSLSIRPKEQQNRRINLSQQQAAILGWTSLLLVPLAGFTTAGLIWWRRR